MDESLKCQKSRRRPFPRKTEPRDTEKSLADSLNELHRIYAEIASAHKAGNLKSFQHAIRVFQMHVLTYDFEFDDEFVVNRTGEILLESAFDDQLASEDVAFVISILEELWGNPSFVEAFMKIGAVQQILANLQSRTDQCLRMLAYLAWNQPDVAQQITDLNVPGDIIQMLIESDDRDFLVKRARNVLSCLYSLSISAAPEKLDDWISSMNALFECKLLDFPDLTYLIPMASNLCNSHEAAAKLSACEPFVALLNDILQNTESDDTDADFLATRSPSLEDRLDSINFLTRVLTFSRGAPDPSFLKQFAMPTVKSVFTSASEPLITQASQWLYAASQIPLLQPEIGSPDFLALIASIIDDQSFTTKKHLVHSATTLIRDASNFVIPSLIDAGITHIVASGLSLYEDQHLLSDVLQALIKLLAANHDKVVADLGSDQIPFLCSVLSDPTAITEQNDALIRAFLTSL